jgi:hypothetical protein
MAKQSGMGWTTLTIDDASGSTEVIKNDVTSFQFATPRGVLDVTGVDKSAVERILLLADFSITLNTTAVNFASTPSFFDVFKTVSSTDVARTTTLTIATKTLAPEVRYTDFQINRGQDGSLGATVPGVLADGTVPTWA